MRKDGVMEVKELQIVKTLEDKVKEMRTSPFLYDYKEIASGIEMALREIGKDEQLDKITSTLETIENVLFELSELSFNDHLQMTYGNFKMIVNDLLGKIDDIKVKHEKEID
jgi:hypothetical protein